MEKGGYMLFQSTGRTRDRNIEDAVTPRLMPIKNRPSRLIRRAGFEPRPGSLEMMVEMEGVEPSAS